MNPQIEIVSDVCVDQTSSKFDSITVGGFTAKPFSVHNWPGVGLPAPLLMLANHTSMLDVIVFAAAFPWSTYNRYCRTLAKATLAKVPLVGKMIFLAGHFPVHFAKGDEGDENISESFRVDKERQKLVMAQIQSFIAAKEGYLTVFPEGQ
jgi:1-acyl-sn-glycerol-3-phosphate acyltransferase